jgi:hypothetical protein
MQLQVGTADEEEGTYQHAQLGAVNNKGKAKAVAKLKRSRLLTNHVCLSV